MSEFDDSQCLGKHKFTEKKLAERVASRGGGRQNVYKCPLCKHWHIGSTVRRGKGRE